MDVSAVRSNVVSAPHSQAVAADIAQRRELIQASKVINSNGVFGSNELVFVVDSRTHRAIMRVVDRDTQEVVMQLPPEYVLNLADELRKKS